MTQGTNKIQTIKEKLELIKYFTNNSPEIAERIGKQVIDLFNPGFSFNHEGQDYYESNNHSIPLRQFASNLITVFEKNLISHTPVREGVIGMDIMQMFSKKTMNQKTSDDKYPTAMGLKNPLEIENIGSEIILDATQHLIAGTDSLLAQTNSQSKRDQLHQIVLVDRNYDSALFLNGREILNTTEDEVDSQTVFELADSLSQLFGVRTNHIMNPANDRRTWTEIKSDLINDGVLMGEKSGATPLNELQSLVAKNYDGGKFAYANTLEKANAINDSLFGYLIDEARHSDGDVSLEEFTNMVSSAEKQLRSLTGDLQEHQEQALPGVRP